ncbi:MAG TPA: VIT domain-containing protein, partial [Armatimonadota bacterium]
YDEKIEAVYVFPLPHTAAVDDMTMVIGDRRSVGVIKRRGEARYLYEQALQQGFTASLLEQERPNIFTQTVGNIKPKQEVRIEISYVDVLKYDMGVYEFHFPMVVGPRYIPGAPISKAPNTSKELQGKVGTVEGPATGADSKGTGWSADTNQVPDASRITPPVLKPGYRNGHDISLKVTLNAGVPIQDLQVVNHTVTNQRSGAAGVSVALSPEDAIPNKDFVMRYNVVGEKPAMAFLPYNQDSGQGYFMLMVQPRIDKSLAQAPPRELVFLVDVSGSMSGAPTEKVKETMRGFFKLSKPDDTFQVITFAGQANKLFEKPVPATEENVGKALSFNDGYQAGGGTEMLKGIKMTLDEPTDPQRVRIVIMLTDGFIGNEAEIISEVGKRAGDQVRFWTLGIGSSPNRLLLDGVAKQGGGASATIELKTDPFEIVRQVTERIHRAQLAHIQIDWQGLPVYEVYPRRIPELWAGRPVILFGRYFNGGSARITLSGTAEGQPLSYDLEVNLPYEKQLENEVLAKVWARQKIEDLTSQMYDGELAEVVEEITNVALEYRLMSQYTSFVAVDENEADRLVLPANPPRRLPVAVPLPEGVSYEGLFGPEGEVASDKAAYAIIPMASNGKPGAAGPQGPAGPAGQANYRQRVQSSGASGSGIQLAGLGLLGSLSPLISPTGGSVSGSTAAAPVSTLREIADMPADSRLDLAGQAIQANSAKRHEEAKTALAESQQMQKKDELLGALLRARHAYLLETAYLATNSWNNDGTLAAAAAQIRTVSDALAAKREHGFPALAKRLDLTIRDLSIAEALQRIGKAAGIDVEVLPGSLQDAAELSGTSELRVTYLNLRQATVTQALDWLLTPVYLDWRMEKDGVITVGTSRRLMGTAAWVYRVGDLAVPTKAELGNETDQSQRMAQALDAFLAGIRLVIGQQDDAGLKSGSAVFISSGKLLVYGGPEVQATVSALLAALKDPAAKLDDIAARLSIEDLGTLRSLQKATATRWATRADARRKYEAAVTRGTIVKSLDAFSWPLLSGTLLGQTDLEALTELQIAWKDDALLKAVLDSPSGWVAWRAAWVLGEAARRRPADTELAALARKAFGMIDGRYATAVGLLAKKPDDAALFITVLYGTLAMRDTETN